MRQFDTLTAYPNQIKAHKFERFKSGLSRCSCGHWFLAGASEASAIHSHQDHIANLPDERLLHPVKASTQDLPALAVESVETPYGTLCPKARRSLALAKDVLGEQAVTHLLPTVEFRTATFECIDRWS